MWETVDSPLKCGGACKWPSGNITSLSTVISDVVQSRISTCALVSVTSFMSYFRAKLTLEEILTDLLLTVCVNI